jgi:hypothetical protein
VFGNTCEYVIFSILNTLFLASGDDAVFTNGASNFIVRNGLPPGPVLTGLVNVILVVFHATNFHFATGLAPKYNVKGFSMSLGTCAVAK